MSAWIINYSHDIMKTLTNSQTSTVLRSFGIEVSERGQGKNIGTGLRTSAASILKLRLHGTRQAARLRRDSRAANIKT